MKILIGIDDINPLIEMGGCGHKIHEQMLMLHELFGCKFTLFVPANFHGRASLVDYPKWINQVNQPYIELAAHGLLHRRNKNDDCEFLDTCANECIDKLEAINKIWEQVGIIPNGWKSPGWITNGASSSVIQEKFQWVASHPLHDYFSLSNAICGHTGIDQAPQITGTDTIVFQSHISAPSLNTWDRNYATFIYTLQCLKNHLKNLQFMTFSEYYNSTINQP